ncbi:filamentous hemagglutinin N-terminal domain-containing protein [Nodosilinea sp. AN01ver1]|uniref:two-partner secretion domain-containing protein n=1 Tax=Nodosilinea sp. AN01ver1 TaxID=3423362 RepID=UPI003D31DB4B
MAIFPALSKALLTRSLSLTTTLVLLSTAGATPLAQAQVIPDATLGNEASTVTPNMPVSGSEADLIEGGALRGSNLFHSFLEFNVDAGQRLYFANPAGVESILSRITGGNPSAIFGTLGVDGAADLFLINPNGLVFGETATLDIQGSFYASTAEAIPIGDGVYSATAPEQSTLLTVNPSALFSNYLSESSGNIVSRAPLAAGENLTLAANQLDLQRQVTAGGDLTLLGNTVQIRDAVNAPFIGFAGGNLLVQGNEQVDVVALNHPDSGLYSYGNMVLRSQNPVGGDAHYWSGGNFRVETLNGSGGSLFSPIDPIIRTFGDVFIEIYVGSSLHILAGGNVTLGTVAITAPDPGALEIDFLQETVTLSDSTVVQVDGGAQPTLDVRAGVRQEALGTPPIEQLTGFNPNIDTLFGNEFPTDTPSSADIAISDVLIAAPNGLVLLTNQYQPNPDLIGGSITVTGDGLYGRGIETSRPDEQGGTVYLDARADVSVINSYIATSAVGNVGDVVINAGGTARFEGINGIDIGGISANLNVGAEGTGGNIRINATNLDVLNGAQIRSVVFGSGQGGDLIFNIRNTARFAGSSSGASSSVGPGGEGQGGNVQISARNLEVLDGAVLRADTLGLGDAGSVILEIEELARFAGRSSGAFSSINPSGEGQGGDVQISARNLEVLGGAQLSAGTFGFGNAGRVILEIEELARFAGSSSGAFSSIELGGEGQGGNVRISARNLEVVDGAVLSADTAGLGDAGNVILEIEELAQFVGSNPLSRIASGAFSSIELGGVGQGGDVRISARNLEVVDGAVLSADTAGLGDAGNVILEIEELAQFVGSNPLSRIASGAFSRIELGGEGQGGDVQISARNLEVLDGAQLNASTQGLGDAGSVILEIEELARFAGRSSGAFSSINPSGVGQGGNVQISARNLEVVDGAVLRADTLGLGDAGSVILEIEELAQFAGFNPFDGNSGGAFSSITLNGEGQGGDVQISARNLEVLDGAQLNASTQGLGDAGSVILEIEELARFAGSNPINGSPSGAFGSVGPDGEGQGGNVQISARNLEVVDGAVLFASTQGLGDAGNVILDIEELAQFSGFNPFDGNSGGAFSSITLNGEGQGGNVQISARNLEVLDGAVLFAGTQGLGDAGSVILEIGGLARFAGFNPINGSSSGAFSSIDLDGEGQGGDVQISARNLEVLDGAQLAAGTQGLGDAGNVILEIEELAQFVGANPVNGSPSGAFSSITLNGEGQGGNIQLTAKNLEIFQGAGLAANSLGLGDAGNIILLISEGLLVDDGTITTTANAASGGQVSVQAGRVILRSDSDIQTSVRQGEGGGGNITIASNFLIALEDSDILAFSADGRGGIIDLSRTTFFGQNPSIAARNLSLNELLNLDENDRVDINATGGIESGQIFVGDATFVENSLTALTDAIVDTSALTAGSCIARSQDSLGSFAVTGRDGLPATPGDGGISAYPTGTVRAVDTPVATQIQEPDGVYQLPNGRLVLGRACD